MKEEENEKPIINVRNYNRTLEEEFIESVKKEE